MPLNYLYNTKLKNDKKESSFFFTPKNRIQIQPNKFFLEIYEKYRDPDDNIIYLQLRNMESF